jgi:hypothetical protein
VDEAMRRRVLYLTVRAIKDRNARYDHQEILDLIDEEVNAADRRGSFSLRISTMERAIKDLCQLRNSDFFEELAIGIGHIMEVVDELEAAAAKLLQTDEFYRPRNLENYPAKVLRNLSQEEAAKILILLDAVRCAPSMRSWTLAYFYDHIAKGIYAHACHWRLGQFKELEQPIESLRSQYQLYSEGIFSNNITYFREYDLYVNYVRDDSRGRGASHHWTRPNRQAPVLDLPDFPPLVVEVARALHRAGVTTQAGLAVVDEVWRPVELRPEMGIDERQQLNRKTLDVLRQRGLLVPASNQIYERVEYEWLFPLWPFELGHQKVKVKDLRSAQRAWPPEDQ